ncbi:MAG: hypothetical protein WAQ17_08630, partial [Limnochordia bacterium]
AADTPPTAVSSETKTASTTSAWAAPFLIILPPTSSLDFYFSPFSSTKAFAFLLPSWGITCKEW